jgi:diacylglycerol O-acyltransferase / wax synthase
LPANDGRPSRLRRRLTGFDSSFLYAESANSPLHIGFLLIFEGHVPFDGIVRAIGQRIHLLPQYRQRLAEVPFNLAHPSLEDDPEFRLDNHVRRYQLPPGIDEAHAIQHLLYAYQPLLDRTRPLWELLSFENWPGGNTVIVSKIHHALVDAVAAVELMKVLLDFRPDAPSQWSQAHRWKPDRVPNPTQTLASAMLDLLVGQFDSLTRIVNEQARINQGSLGCGPPFFEAMRRLAELDSRQIVSTPWNSGPVTDARSLTWLRNSTTDYRAICDAFGGTFNDVALTVVSEGAARYLKHHRYSCDGWFRIACPVNLRRPHERTDVGNRVSMMLPAVPAAPMDPVERLNVVRDETERMKEDGIAEAWEQVMSLRELVPPGLLALTSPFGMPGHDGAAALVPAINFAATNVPGVEVPQYLCGHRCLEQIFLLPLVGNLGYGVAVLSYNQSLHLAMIADPWLVPDLGLMRALVQNAFEELRAAA